MSNSTHHLSSAEFGLGDICLLTAICKYQMGKFAVMLPHEYERFKVLFQGLADVIITEREKCLPLRDIGTGHYGLRKLRYVFGEAAENMDIRPLILYADPVSESWISEYLKDKPNPVIVCPFVAPRWASVRNLPEEIIREIFGAAKYRGQTPIVIQSDTDKTWDCAVLNNLELPKLICLMRRVGNLVGANTGLYHLAVGVGAKVECFYPANTPYFNPDEWCYFNHPTITHRMWSA